MSGKTPASDKPVQTQPALPKRLPPWWPLAGSAKIASQLRHTQDQLLNGQSLDGQPELRGDHLRLLWLDPGQSWLLRLFSTQVAQLQQAHRDGRDQRQEILQTGLFLQKALLQPAPRLHPA